MSIVVIEQTGAAKVEVENRKAATVTIHNEHRIVVIGSGTSGSGDITTTRRAAATVSALRLVSEQADGVRPLNPADDDSVAGMLGVTITAADEGDMVRLRSLAGDSITDAAWAWTPGFVFAGPNGTLTQIVPVAGWEIVVGYAPSPTRLNLTFDEPLKLA